MRKSLHEMALELIADISGVGATEEDIIYAKYNSDSHKIELELDRIGSFEISMKCAGECRIKELETVHLKPNKTVTEWKVGEKSYFVFNNSGLYFDVYDNIKRYGAPEICSDYNAEEWNSFGDFEEDWNMQVKRFLKEELNK